LMAPLTISTLAEYPSAEDVPLQQLVGNEFDALIEWFASSSSSSGSALVPMPGSCEAVEYDAAAAYSEGVGVGCDRNGSGEYDPLCPGFSLLKPTPVPSSRVVGGGGKVHYLSTEKEMENEKDVEGYDPSNPKLSLPMTMLMRGLSLSQLSEGDRRRLDAMKQRRIEERRERRGRDPVTGAKVAVFDGEVDGRGKKVAKGADAGKGKGKGMKVTGMGMKGKERGEKVASGRVGKIGKR
ncbi:MAG: hypothetical protein Q9192_006059, partial [Flavoplaca navasiana]